MKVHSNIIGLYSCGVLSRTILVRCQHESNINIFPKHIIPVDVLLNIKKKAGTDL